MTTKANITRKMALHQVAAAIMAPLAGARARAVDATAKITEVKITDFTFSPSALTVAIGTTVTWTNEDDAPHTVDATTRAFGSGVLDTDQRFSFTFTTPGTYKYFCALHPHMTGTIVVQAASGDNAPS
jgi:plastocyanin